MQQIAQNFATGLKLGERMRENYDESKAGEAMADLYGYDPMQNQQQVEQDTQEGGMFGQQQDGQAKLPSTRDWVTMRQEAIKRVGRLGPKAVASAMDEIDSIQEKGALDNLYRTRQLLESGEDVMAGKHWEAANSYLGNFTVPHTSPAKMRDGSTKLAFSMDDEQTGQPRMPGMILTTDVVDRAIEMVENKGELSKMRHDRMMAERNFQRETFESDRGYGLDVAKADAQYGWKAQEAAEKKLTTAKHMTDFLKSTKSDFTTMDEMGNEVVDPKYTMYAKAAQDLLQRVQASGANATPEQVWARIMAEAQARGTEG